MQAFPLPAIPNILQNVSAKDARLQRWTQTSLRQVLMGLSLRIRRLLTVREQHKKDWHTDIRNQLRIFFYIQNKDRGEKEARSLGNVSYIYIYISSPFLSSWGRQDFQKAHSYRIRHNLLPSNKLLNTILSSNKKALLQYRYEKHFKPENIQ